MSEVLKYFQRFLEILGLISNIWKKHGHFWHFRKLSRQNVDISNVENVLTFEIHKYLSFFLQISEMNFNNINFFKQILTFSSSNFHVFSPENFRNESKNVFFSIKFSTFESQKCHLFIQNFVYKSQNLWVF